MTREEALEELKEIRFNLNYKVNGTSRFDEALDMAIKVLQKEPYEDDINNRVRDGHWILLDECANSGYYCSECRKKVVKEGWSDTVKKIKYCPNCGAKMQNAEE